MEAFVNIVDIDPDIIDGRRRMVDPSHVVPAGHQLALPLPVGGGAYTCE